MNTDNLRGEIEALDAEIQALHQNEDGELREFTPDEQETFDAKRAERASKVALLARHEEIQKAAQIPERTVAPAAPNVIISRDAMEVRDDRSATRTQLADAATRQLERFNVADDNLGHARSLLQRHAGDRQWVDSIIARATPEYSSAFGKIMLHREFDLTPEERTVLGVTTNANGKFLLPTHLDPSLILTSARSTNKIRQISRVVTLMNGEAAWNGITSAGITASWDGEVVEVSDDTPTFGNPSIATNRAQALAQASISASEDIANLSNDLVEMFALARDNLEGAAHATGLGSSNQPKGVFTAVTAITASRVTSTTAATIGLVDLNALYVGVPDRYRGSSTFVANPVYTVAIKSLGTSVGASFSGDLSAGLTSVILDRPVVSSDWAPSTQTTTALDSEVLLGDFQQYVIVDRPGDMIVEYIPHLFATANNLPDGRRGWYASWRNGADVTNVDAFRLLVDKTTA